MSWGSQSRLAKLRAFRETQRIQDVQGYTENQNIINGRWDSVAEALRREDQFKQRILQITEWFNVWSSAQRCQFFSWFLRRCANHELEYLQGWFIQRSPVLRQDFTSVLTRELSLYIFSFLDPKSLCRSAGVSWHWRFLAEQDCLWIPKCARYGWFLPYVPSEREYGSWKYHYIECAIALDTQTVSLQLDFESTSEAGGSDNEKETLDNLNRKREKQMKVHYDLVRPPWQVPDKNPRILESNYKSMLSGKFSPDDERTQNKLLFRRLQSAPGLIKFGRSWKSKALKMANGKKSAPYDNLLTKTSVTSKSLNDISELNIRYLNQETNFKEINWKQVSARSPRTLKATLYHSNSIPIYATRAVKSSTGLLTGSRGSVNASSLPRVVFMSSRMPAKEILLECILYGVVAIPYDYEGTTLDSLLVKLELILGSRQAQSIAFVLDGNEADGTLNMVEGSPLSAETMQDERIKTFWRRMVYHIKPSKSETLDIFWPIATTDKGLSLVTEIQSVTGMTVSCPVGFSGSYNRFETDWLVEYKEGQASLANASKVFNMAKLRNWGYYCKYLEEAFSEVKILMEETVSHYQIDVTHRIIGELMFKLTKMTDVAAIETLGKSLERAIQQTWEHDGKDGVRDKVDRLRESLELEFQAERRKRRLSRDLQPVLPLSSDDVYESRFFCVQKIIEIEADHIQNLKILVDIYQLPLLSCLQSNRGVISSSTIKILFSDCDTLLKVDEDVLNCLLQRTADWTQNQHIGDVYVKFSTNLKAYCNFLKNYPAILCTLQKNREENPIFRAFLEGQRLRSEAKGMSYVQLLLSPAQILSTRCQLLASLLKCTPADHEDRKYLTSALGKIRDVADSFDQAKERLRNEEKFEVIQRRIKNCPNLIEPGRTLLREMHVSQLSLTAKSKEASQESDEMYLKVKDLVLFLFDDILVLCRKLNQHRPFSRTVNIKLVFAHLLALDRLKTEDVPDSKYLTNAFRLVYGKQRFLCKTSGMEEKLSYLAILNNRIKLAIPLATSIMIEANRSA